MPSHNLDFGTKSTKALNFNNSDVKILDINNNIVWAKPFTYLRGELPTGVNSITCYRKSSICGASIGEVGNNEPIYWHDEIYFTATGGAGYLNPNVDYTADNPLTVEQNESGSDYTHAVVGSSFITFIAGEGIDSTHEMYCIINDEPEVFASTKTFALQIGDKVKYGAIKDGVSYLYESFTVYSPINRQVTISYLSQNIEERTMELTLAKNVNSKDFTVSPFIRSVSTTYYEHNEPTKVGQEDNIAFFQSKDWATSKTSNINIFVQKLQPTIPGSIQLKLSGTAYDCFYFKSN